jgi:streptogramin lyase
MGSGISMKLHDTLKNTVLKTTIYGEGVKSHGMLVGYEKSDWISDNNNGIVRNMACSKRLPNNSRRN